jgi:hypothetical protein
MAQRTTTTKAERKELVQKLGRFRATLPKHEQAILDALTLTAEGARGAADVQGYQWFWGPDPLNPQWYSGTLPPGEVSPWWENYNTPWS